MGKTAIVMITIILSATNLSGKAHKQPAERQITFHVAGSFLKAIKPPNFKELWNDGTGVSGGITYKLSPVLETGVCVSRDVFNLNGAKAADKAASAGATSLLDSKDISIVALNWLIKMNLLTRENEFRFYLFFQSGLSWANGAYVGAVRNSEDILIAWPFPKGYKSTVSFGTGVDKWVTKDFIFFIEFNYRIIYASQGEFLRPPMPYGGGPEVAELSRISAGIRYSLSL